MLSKYNFFKHNKNITNQEVCDIQSDIANLGFCVEQIQYICGGTLGITGSAVINGRRRFFKTHQDDEESVRNLVKDFVCLKQLYGTSLDVELLTNKRRNYLFMDYLPDSHETAFFSVDQINRQISSMPEISYPDINYSVEDVLCAARESLQLLISCGELTDKDLTLFLDKNLAVFDRECIHMPRRVCHGDFSNKNLLSSKGSIFLIDWEDALAGFVYYDFLYWLTFWQQRKIVSSSLLTHYKIPLEIACSTIMTVLLVKSMISVWNGSYKSNHCSIELRLQQMRRALE